MASASDPVVGGPPSSPQSRKSTKPKRPPPITPKRFTRFFTPRATLSRSTNASTSRVGRQLRDITRSGTNRGSTKRAIPKPPRFRGQENDPTIAPSTPRSTSLKRKQLPSPGTSPLPHSSPCKRPRFVDLETLGSNVDIPSSPPLVPMGDDALPNINEEEDEEEDEKESERSLSPEAILCEPIKKLHLRGTTARIAQRSFGGYDNLGRGRRRDACLGAAYKTSNFYSLADDRHSFQHPRLPFCSATCNTNSIVAAGTETGTIYLMDSSRNARFSRTVLECTQHGNAIMDLQFSPDDSLLATASGDQSARVIDMRTQQTKAVFAFHRSSCKQVRFRPGDDNMIATCSRDGVITLWDTRCRGEERQVVDEIVPGDGLFVEANRIQKVHDAMFHWDPLHALQRAHMDRQALQVMNNSGIRDEAKGQTARSGDVSVTALTFLSGDRSHLLISGSEASTSLKVWDIRARYSRRASALPVPLASTRTPQSHQQYRHYGITSIALNTKESLLYALSRDSTLYAFNTSHLVLGHAPELNPGGSSQARLTSEDREGLGPVYGLRHPKLYTTSFYVKAAVRPASADNCELIAVGSGHESRCAILFPTDPGDFGAPLQREQKFPPSTPMASHPGTPLFTRSFSFGSKPPCDPFPIYEAGTTLDHGHLREITSVNWTREGDLLTLSDDFTCRVWREDQSEARRLRQSCNGADRNRCGWAAAPAGFDEDED